MKSRFLTSILAVGLLTAPLQLSSAQEGELLRARADLVAVEATMALKRAKFQEALTVINRLTNNKRTPVQEGSSAYQQCSSAARIIEAIEKEAPQLVAEKARLTELVKLLDEQAARQPKQDHPAPEGNKPPKSPEPPPEAPTNASPPPEVPLVGPCKKWSDLLARYGKLDPKSTSVKSYEVPEILTARSLEKGKIYATVIKVKQIGGEFVLGYSSLNIPTPTIFSFPKGGFDDITAFEGEYFQIAGRFQRFEEREMASGGTKRIPVFKLIGFVNENRQTFHSFEEEP